MYQPLKIAITGANGFLGRHCIENAVERGISVNAIVRREKAIEIVRKLGGRPVLIRSLERNELTQAFKDCFGVIHLAGIVREEGEDTFEKVNVQGTAAAVMAAKETGVKRFVVPSGLGVDQYGIKAWATNDYFQSKQRIEQITRVSSVPHIIFRPSYILGIGDELVPSVVKQVKRGFVRIAGSGTTVMQPIFVRDACKLFIDVATGLGPENKTFDLVGPSTVNMLQIIDIILEILKRSGVPVPKIRIAHLLIEDAPAALGLSMEEVNVMQCDVVGDPNPIIRAYGISFTSLNDAVATAVKGALEMELTHQWKAQ